MASDKSAKPRVTDAMFQFSFKYLLLRSDTASMRKPKLIEAFHRHPSEDEVFRVYNTFCNIRYSKLVNTGKCTTPCPYGTNKPDHWRLISVLEYFNGELDE